MSTHDTVPFDEQPTRVPTPHDPPADRGPATAPVAAAGITGQADRAAESTHEEHAPAARPQAGGRSHEGPRNGTVVGGLVLVAVGLVILAVGAGAVIDLQAALILLLAISGVALLAGAVATARRNR